MGKLIIHIGPPKTASTSLQHFFQALDHQGFKFIGVYQRRKSEIAKRKNAFRNKIYSYLSDHSNPQLKRSIQEELKKSLKEFNFVFFSEEMILHEPQWQQKIQRLYKLVGCFEPQIIFCVRNPIDALPSYYQEMYRNLPQKIREDYSKFEECGYSEVYNYTLVYQTLERAGFKNIDWFRFEDLISNQLLIKKILKSDSCNSHIFEDKKVVIANKNKSKTESNIRVVEYDAFVDMNRVMRRIIRFLGEIKLIQLHRAVRKFLVQKKNIAVVPNINFNKQYESDLDFLKKIRNSKESGGFIF